MFLCLSRARSALDKQKSKVMVFVEFTGQFSLASWRAEIQLAITQRHPDMKRVVCAYIVSRDLTRVMYGFFENQPSATQGINAMVKQMGSEATYASVFDLGMPVANNVLKGVVVYF